MSRFSKLMVAAALSVALGGCENLAERVPFLSSMHYSQSNGSLVEKDGKTPEGMDRLSQAPGQQPVVGTPYSQDQMLSLAARSSDSSVQLFNVDGSPLSAELPNPLAEGGLPAAADPSVTIFPVNGGMGGAYAQQPYTGMGAGFSPSVVEGGTPAGEPESELGSGYIPSKIYFPHGSASLDGQDKTILKDVAEQAKFAPVDRISVEGHASSRVQEGAGVEGHVLNLKESMNRAQAVTNNLMYNGVPAEKIRTTSWGDTRPPVSGGEAESRRVDVYTGGR